jgi:trehalose 6-phosphate phosphatase
MQVLESNLALDQFFGQLDGSQTGALVLDYDGTLAPFCKDRLNAVPYRGVSQTLFRIMRTGGTRIGIVSGRPVEEVIPLLGIFPIPEIWGLDGLQRLWPDGTCRTSPLSDFDQLILAEASSWLDHQELRHLAEFKTGTITVHWRGLTAMDADRIGDRVRQGWTRLAQLSRMQVLEFAGGIEIRPDRPSKADAVLTIQAELESGVPLAYLGDDPTDENVFKVLKGSSKALTVLVSDEWRETTAKAWMKPPQGLLEFLERWIDCCGGAG